MTCYFFVKNVIMSGVRLRLLLIQLGGESTRKETYQVMAKKENLVQGVNNISTKIIELGSCAFRQPGAKSHCRFIHGYKLYAKFWFACNKLDENIWVVDFGGLKELKQILRNQFDHTLCIDREDPLLNEFLTLEKLGGCVLRIMPKGTGIERISEWCFIQANHFIQIKTEKRCWVVKVEVYENDKNSAVYKK